MISGQRAWDDSDLVPISALEHWAYCPRQCGLIYLEQTFDENYYTLRGRMLHERADEPGAEREGDVRRERGLPLWSMRLGLVGKADVVEFHGDVPYPVEYKHGTRRYRLAAAVPLCAQGMCLEEMTGRPVSRGAIFHQGSRRRSEIVFGEALRLRAEETVTAVRQMLKSWNLPAAVNDRRCPLCSLKDSCLPWLVGEGSRARAALQNLFRPSEEQSYGD